MKKFLTLIGIIVGGCLVAGLYGVLHANQSGLDCDITNPKSEGHENKMNNSDDWVKFTLDLPIL